MCVIGWRPLQQLPINIQQTTYQQQQTTRDLLKTTFKALLSATNCACNDK